MYFYWRIRYSRIANEWFICYMQIAYKDFLVTTLQQTPVARVIFSVHRVG